MQLWPAPGYDVRDDGATRRITVRGVTASPLLSRCPCPLAHRRRRPLLGPHPHRVEPGRDEPRRVVLVKDEAQGLMGRIAFGATVGA